MRWGRAMMGALAVLAAGAGVAQVARLDPPLRVEVMAQGDVNRFVPGARWRMVNLRALVGEPKPARQQALRDGYDPTLRPRSDGLQWEAYHHDEPHGWQHCCGVDTVTWRDPHTPLWCGWFDSPPPEGVMQADFPGGVRLYRCVLAEMGETYGQKLPGPTHTDWTIGVRRLSPTPAGIVGIATLVASLLTAMLVLWAREGARSAAPTKESQRVRSAGNDTAYRVADVEVEVPAPPLRAREVFSRREARWAVVIAWGLALCALPWLTYVTFGWGTR